jgi:hypothetical protein
MLLCTKSQQKNNATDADIPYEFNACGAKVALTAVFGYLKIHN